MLYIQNSNDLEKLAQALAEVVKQPLARPLDTEIIVIQHLGVKHWLSLQLAEKLGIWTNCHFPFLHNLLRKVFRATLAAQFNDPFTQETMEWTIMKILPNFLENKEFEPIKNYLQDDSQGLKCFQLANHIANLFDNYMIFRQEEMMVWKTNQQPDCWKNNTTANWQKTLWQALKNEHFTPDRIELQEQLLRQIADNMLTKAQLKQLLHQEGIQRLSIFGTPALLSSYLNIIELLSQAIDIHIFLFNPCQEYWADIISESEQARKIKYANRIKIPSELLHFDIGNNLLASMGKFGKNFIDILNTYSEHSQIIENFIDPGRNSLLHCIQQDILLLRQAPLDHPKKIIAKNDDSIQIHICHSPMREIEVLHNQLLVLFEKNPQLKPKDIVIAMPVVETYTPLIEAIFATTLEKNKKIPFTIADCNLRHQNILIDAFLTILELQNSRFTSNDVMKILEFEVIQQRFDLTTADLQLIRHWIHQTNIRWGMDKNSHPDLQQADFEENTWKHGLDRLLLGYVLPRVPLHQPEHKEQLFAQILPFDEIEGKDTLILGQLIEFIQRLFAIIQYMSQNHTLIEWQQFLRKVTEDFLVTNHETEEQLQKIYKILNQLAECQRMAKITETISSVVILSYLQRYLEQEPQNTPFLTGQVTFCSVHSLNSIPFKVIYLVGMNDQIFPRLYKPISFDLMAQHPRFADRSQRESDRYLFLTALLAARDYFYISYVGHDIHDNSEISPSVLISELVDYINKSCEHELQIQEKNLRSADLSKKPADYLMITHPLQAFSYRYFSQHPDDEQLVSYTNQYYQAYMDTNPQSLPIFLTTPLSEPKPKFEWQIIELDRFIRFFVNPAEFFLKHRLGIILSNQADFLEENEPFVLTGLEKYQLTQEMVTKCINGQDLQNYYEIVKASGKLPFGHIGKQTYQQYQEDVKQFVTQVKQKSGEHAHLASHPFQLRIGQMTLVGHLKPLYPQGLIHYRYTTLKAKDHLSAWLYHLILNAIMPDNITCHSILMGCGDEILVDNKQDIPHVTWYYEPVTESMTILEKLLQLYWQGLQQPLYFFPKAGLTFVHAFQQKGKSRDEALHQALKVWQGQANQAHSRVESDNPYYQLCFKEIDSRILLGESFQEMALSIFSPLLHAIQQIDK